MWPTVQELADPTASQPGVRPQTSEDRAHSSVFRGGGSSTPADTERGKSGTSQFSAVTLNAKTVSTLARVNCRSSAVGQERMNLSYLENSDMRFLFSAQRNGLKNPQKLKLILGIQAVKTDTGSPTARPHPTDRRRCAAAGPAAGAQLHWPAAARQADWSVPQLSQLCALLFTRLNTGQVFITENQTHKAALTRVI